jgi:hypothetical protein
MFKAIEPLLGQVGDLTDKAFQSPELTSLGQLLSQISNVIGERYSAQLGVRLEIFDREEVRALPLLSTGLASNNGEQSYRTWDNSTLQRYMVEGQIQIVPHDRCPACWGEWDFKFNNRECLQCVATLGREVKILLDTDLCPHCEEGKVSMAEPLDPKEPTNLDAVGGREWFLAV